MSKLDVLFKLLTITSNCIFVPLNNMKISLTYVKYALLFTVYKHCGSMCIYLFKIMYEQLRKYEATHKKSTFWNFASVENPVFKRLIRKLQMS